MDKNTFFAIFLSTAFLIVWFMFIQKPAQQQAPSSVVASSSVVSNNQAQTAVPSSLSKAVDEAPEQLTTVETADYKAVFTNRGAAIKHWYLKEKSGTLVDLVNGQEVSQFVNFPGSSYDVLQPSPLKLVFTNRSPLGWQVTKTYDLTDNYLHSLTIQTSKIKNGAKLPVIDVAWGPGLGTDDKGQKDNMAQTRALGYAVSRPTPLEKFKPGDYPSKIYRWAAIDNRYFLAALIPTKDTDFSNINVTRDSKKQPPEISLSAPVPENVDSQPVPSCSTWGLRVMNT